MKKARFAGPRPLGPWAFALTVAIAAATGAHAAGRDVVLPTEWQLAPAPGAVASTKTFPESATRTGDGRRLIVVEGGAGSPGIAMFDAASLAKERDLAVESVYGVPLADPTGSGFWVGTAARDGLVHYDAASGRSDRQIALPAHFWPAAIARSPDGKTLAVSGDLAGSVVFVALPSGAVSAPVPVGSAAESVPDAAHDQSGVAPGAAARGDHPAGLVFSPDGGTLVVANWGGTTLAVVDVATRTLRAQIAVGRHPEALALAPDGRRLFVSEPDDDALGVVDLATRRRVADLDVAPWAGKLYGASPSALALAPDGRRLYVTLAAANAVAVVDVADGQPRLLGALPAGWYPSALSVSPDARTLTVVDAMGESGRANPQFKPFGPRGDPDRSGYVAAGMIGSLRTIPIPADDALAAATEKVRQLAGPALGAALGTAAAPKPPAGSVVRPGGPISHVLYIVKENRTYDQVLGDLPGADGDPSLTLFGSTVTPNEHALARRFGILDDTFADAEVSADGHNWSMAAFANDYLERMWPQNYGGRRKLYDFEDGASASVPHAGFLWNNALRHGVSLRNYGEFTSDPQPDTQTVVSHMPGLAEVTDPRARGFDLTFDDNAREAEWAREYDAFDRSGTLPQLEIMRLPNDHTAGTRPGALTPTAFVAQNDLAVGKVVEHLSHSRHWRDTAIFIVEDDAQNGADHVDAQRMTAYVVSAYAQGGVVHVHHSTAGIVRTIELLLGLPPMSAYDAAAAPLYDAFGPTPDLRPYTASPERVDVRATNPPSAYRASESARLDFRREDSVADATLNDEIWHAVRGARASPPPWGAFPR